MQQKSLHYKRARFATHLPLTHLYSPSHFWIAQQPEGLWRVGLTKFASRMLGEMVDHGFSVELNAPLAPGQVIGWLEGFKAISDIFCIGQGRFAGPNPLLKDDLALIAKDPYGEGWLYQIDGQPDQRCMSVDDYVRLLDKTIDKILERQKTDEEPPAAS